MIPKIRHDAVLYRSKLREVNMKNLIKMSKYAYVDGSILQYFVRKYLEVSALGTTIISPISNPLTMYGFKKNIHFVDKNEFLLDPTKYLEQFNETKIRHEDITKLINQNHTFEIRVRQLCEFLEGLLSDDNCYGSFKNGKFFMSSNSR